MSRMIKNVCVGPCRCLQRRGASLGIALLIGAAGCGSSELETGYKPRLLSASDAQRKAYYAPQYSREAAMAAQQQQQQGNTAADMSRHRPGASY